MTGTTKLQNLVQLLAYYADGIIGRDELISKIAEDRTTIEMLPFPTSCFPPRETLRGEAEALHLARARGQR